ncbi:MAG: nicotinate-nucleotide adenylyltransferase [Candidatus Deferrimicrobiaceae bacterium]
MDAKRPSSALFGGTFDPFHNGHLRMAIEVKEALTLSRVVLLPAHHPPHKPRQPVSGAEHRFAMVSAAIAGLSGFEVSDREIRHEGPSYSLTTVRDFCRAEPGVDWAFVMGADSFGEISTWHRYEELLTACNFVLLPRHGTPRKPVPPGGMRIEKEDPHCYSWTGESYRLPGGRMLYCPALPALDISSRSIREKVRSGHCLRGLVPPEVENYIAKHGLYLGTGEEERP